MIYRNYQNFLLFLKPKYIIYYNSSDGVRERRKFISFLINCKRWNEYFIVKVSTFAFDDVKVFYVKRQNETTFGRFMVKVDHLNLFTNFKINDASKLLKLLRRIFITLEIVCRPLTMSTVFQTISLKTVIKQQDFMHYSNTT